MRYAVWNNKGGVGKSFLSFVLATEISHTRGHLEKYSLEAGRSAIEVAAVSD